MVRNKKELFENPSSALWAPSPHVWGEGKINEGSYLDAWLIHKTPIGDTSVRARFLTREKGLIDCYYRGGRNPKKNTALQPFTPFCLFTNERHHWFYVKGLEPTELPLSLNGPCLFSALYVNELVYYTIPLQEPDAPLFMTYQNTLQNLAKATSPAAIEITLRRFEKTLLTACGYSLGLTAESPLADTITPTEHYQFMPNHGFKKNQTGIPGAHILAILQDQLDCPLVLKSAKFLMRQAIDTLLGGKPLKSRSLYLPNTKS